MFGSECFDFSLWWIFQIIMIALCFFIMRGWTGSMMCGHDSHGKDSHRIHDSEAAIDILDKRYALSEINREEYEEKKEP